MSTQLRVKWEAYNVWLESNNGPHFNPDLPILWDVMEENTDKWVALIQPETGIKGFVPADVIEWTRSFRLAEIIKKAEREIEKLCHGKKWTMRVPVQDNDSDLIISGAMVALTKELERLRSAARALAKRNRLETDQDNGDIYCPHCGIRISPWDYNLPTFDGFPHEEKCILVEFA